MITSLRLFCWFYLFLGLSTPLMTLAASDPVLIGILSFRSIEQTEQQWQGLADYLQQAIPDHRFRIMPLYYPELNATATSNHLDFVLTNPEHYVILRQKTGLNAMATLMPLADGHPVNQFGGVIAVSAQRRDLQTLSDLTNKIVASPGRESFGGFIMQQWELYKQGIEVRDYLFTGMPHDKVIDAVLQGKADAGFVRSGIIEALVKEGKIKAEAIRIIHQQPHPGFPQTVSTTLYPEWPFCALPQTDTQLVKAVTLALLNLDSGHPASQAARIFGFSPPGDYSMVEAVMLNLSVHPEELKNISLRDVYYRYRQVIWVGVFFSLLIVLLSIKLFRVYRHLRRAYLKYHLVADYTSDWEYWLGPDGAIVYMSPSCQAITGYSAKDFKRNPQLLEQLLHPDDMADFLNHQQNHTKEKQNGELEFRILNNQGEIRWIHHLCRPIYDKKNCYQGIRASNRDITHRKYIEMELRLHDAALKACADAIVITDVNAVIHWVNPAFCLLTGYSEAEALGRKPADLVKSGQHDEAFYQNIWQTILSGQNWRGEVINRRKNGELYYEQLSITPVYCEDESVCYFVAVKQDISERKHAENKIHQLAFHDPLTQLANRRLLIDRLEQVIASCRRNQEHGAILFIDLDRFKLLNDQYGHDIGDQLLLEVANRLKSVVRQQDTVARLGGDEFVVMLTELASDPTIASQQAEQVAQKIHSLLNRPYQLQVGWDKLKQINIEYQLSASIGISLFMETESNTDKILKQADIAMYEAKHQGRNAICCFH